MRKICELQSCCWHARAQQSRRKNKRARLPSKPGCESSGKSFKDKDKAALSSVIDDHFRMFEEGLSAFADKKAEVNAVDEFELVSYTLSDFTVKSLGPNSALVTYIAQYEGKTGGESSKAKSVFGEVWTRSGNEWKALYLQETYMK